MHYSNTEDAIEQYNIAILNGYIPIALEKRATAYIINKDYTKALIDLKEAATHNTDYYYSVGYTFELMKKYDSALSYFELYHRFSGNEDIKLQIDSLKQKLNR